MGGGELVGPGPENKVIVDQVIDLKFGTKDGIDNTSKYAKFKVIGFSTLRDMVSQNYPSPEGNKSLRLDIYPLETTKIRGKALFTLENFFSGPKLCLIPNHFSGFRAKQKNDYVRFF